MLLAIASEKYKDIAYLVALGQHAHSLEKQFTLE
jgi:hypothetical protein